MKFQRNILASRATALLSGAMLLAAVPMSGALAADTMPVKGVVVAETGWYWNGEVEAGSNIFIKKPGDGFGRDSAQPFWLTPTTTDSRQKMDEYGHIPRSVFLQELGIHAGSKDGRYGFDFWADNIGTDFQKYFLDLYEPGRQYFYASWDQTPHLLSSSAKSIFSGVGTNRLTVDPTTKAFLQSHLGQSAGTGNAGQTANDRICIDDYINGRVSGGCVPAFGLPGALALTGAAPMNQLELKTLREKASLGYRNTMLDAWDFNVDYSNEHRTGNRPLGIGWGYAAWNGNPALTAGANGQIGFVNTLTGIPAGGPRPSSGAVEVPQPIDDRTQNANASGEYVGTTPWGTRWNTSVKYSGSFYNNSIKSIDVDNPFCNTCTAYTGGLIGANLGVGANIFRYGLAPDNNANGVTWNTSVNLPIFKTRYVTTLQYTQYRQNDTFIDTATNGVTYGAAVGQINPYPANSLTGGVNAFLSNNVFTSELTHSLHNTLKVRYYDRKDNTQTLTFNNYNFGDGGVATAAEQIPVTRMPHSYTKLNLEDQLKWDINRTWAVGAGPVFERMTYQNGEVDSTNEVGGKAFVNMTMRLATWRASVEYTQRRYNTYLAGSATDPAANAMRYFFVANRDRTKGSTVLELAAFKNVTISPNGGFRWDDYPADQTLTAITTGTSLSTLGTRYDRGWNIGADANWRPTPTVKLGFGYNHEEHYLRMQTCCGGSSVIVPGPPTVPYTDGDKWASDIRQFYNTFIFSADWKAIPGKLDFKADYLMALSTEANQTQVCTTAGCVTGAGTGVTVNQVQFPDEKNKFQRFNFIAKYYVDKDVVKRMGWFGDVTLKARYTWERNNNSNWATDTMSPYSPSAADSGGDTTSGGRSLFLAYNNPNYTAQIVALSVATRW